MLVAVLLACQGTLGVEVLNGDGKPKPRGTAIEGIAVDVRIRALDADGEVDRSVSGPVTIEGLRGPLAPMLEHGELILKEVVVTGPTIKATVGERAGDLAVTFIPGWMVILPPLVAIVLAIVTRQVLVSLLVGVMVGVFFAYAFAPLDALLGTFDTYLINAGADGDHMKIIVFTLALGGMVGIISRSGGTRGVAEAIARWAKTRVSAQIATWAMGLAIFFDDYANCLIVGTAVRPYADKLRISREKLSFIVDSTAAPVATVAIISTWVGYQLGLLDDAGIAGADGPYAFFLNMIPYSLYSIFMLAFVFLIGATGRDFGPMLVAERRAATEGKVLRDGAEPLVGRELSDIESDASLKPHWINAALPIGTVIVTVLGGLYYSGRDESHTTLREIVGNANSYNVLVWASIAGGLVAGLTALAQRQMKLKDVVDAYIGGTKALLLAIFILILAWSIGQVCKDLDTGPWIASFITGGSEWLPVAVFLMACGVAFATGTSFGTMAILIPVAAPILLQMDGVTDPMKFSTMAAILTGAIFGDHCSPISDTTILSSMGSGSDHVDHVRTQLPYALTCAGVSALGFVAFGFGVPVWIVLPLGLAALVGIVLGVGKKV